jgi:uncharacterized spore protein YtfJ
MTKVMNGEVDALDLLAKIRESMTVHTAIGDPIKSGDITILPVARVTGGGGGGGGGRAGGESDTSSDAAEQVGGGAGFGMMSKPVGVFVIKNGEVTWRPALDVNKIILGGQLVLLVGLLVLRGIFRSRRRQSATRR